MVSDQPRAVGRAPRSDATDEMLTTAIVAELPRLRRLQDPAKLRSWLFSILNNFFLMRLRSEARRGQTLQIEDFADSLAVSASSDDRQLARDLARAMGKLSAEHRQILLLLNVEGYGYQEVADTLGIPIGTVMSRLARARRRLRALLEGHELQVVD